MKREIKNEWKESKECPMIYDYQKKSLDKTGGDKGPRRLC